VTDFDVLVVGGGWGGYTAARTIAQHGGRVALVEQDKIGGVCLHRGCIPTKALLETAAIARQVRRAPAHGLKVPPPQLDWPQALDFKNSVVDKLHAGMQQALDLAKVERIDGTARMTAATEVRVAPSAGGATTEIVAKDLIIATGSQPAGLPFFPVDGARIITSDHAIDLPPPARPIIVGGGAVGVEFASLWTDLGSDVVLLELQPQLLPQEDADIARTLATQLAARGVDVRTGAAIDADSVRIGPQGVQLEIEQDGERHALSGDVVLVAIGRRPRSDQST
jgi:dihydrolipoamide dehydrogenase